MQKILRQWPDSATGKLCGEWCYPAEDVDAELKKLKALEGMHEAAHKIANEYLADSRDTHIADKICLIGNQRDDLRAAASNLLKKHKLGAVTEADVVWLETEIKLINKM